MDIFKSDKFKGFCISNLVVVVLTGFVKFVGFSQLNRNWYFANNQNPTLIYSTFVILPILMGIISAWYWKDLGLSRKRLVGYSLQNGFWLIMLSYIFLGEGMICLIIVSPLIFVFVITGAFIGRQMFKKKSQTLNVSILSLLFFFAFADAASEHHYENLVSDEIIINAPATAVWKNVVAFEPIKRPDNYWLFKIGMPSPMQTTVDGYYNGSGRKCIFSNGYVFDEKIISFKENKDLTFDILKQPQDPEIMGHIKILRGQFLLHDNGNGTTTLTGNSWYQLYVFPIWYYDMWAKSITRNVHLRVMDHIKELSEKR